MSYRLLNEVHSNDIASAFPWLLRSSGFGLYSLMASNERSRIKLSWNEEGIVYVNHASLIWLQGLSIVDPCTVINLFDSATSSRSINSWLCVPVMIPFRTREFYQKSCYPGPICVIHMHPMHDVTYNIFEMIILFPYVPMLRPEIQRRTHCHVMSVL